MSLGNAKERKLPEEFTRRNVSLEDLARYIEGTEERLSPLSKIKILQETCRRMVCLQELDNTHSDFKPESVQLKHGKCKAIVCGMCNLER